MILRIAVCFILLVVSACAHRGTAARMQLSFAMEPVQGSAPENAEASGNDQSIHIIGRLDVTGCDDVGARLSAHAEHGLALVITRRARPAPCDRARSAVRYSATAAGLQSGRYHLQVLHTSEPPTAPRTVFHDFVTVQ